MENIEKFPIDWLIADILSMKREAWEIKNKKLFGYADYLEKRLFQVKNGEIELELTDVEKLARPKMKRESDS